STSPTACKGTSPARSDAAGIFAGAISTSMASSFETHRAAMLLRTRSRTLMVRSAPSARLEPCGLARSCDDSSERETPWSYRHRRGDGLRENHGFTQHIVARGAFNSSCRHPGDIAADNPDAGCGLYRPHGRGRGLCGGGACPGGRGDAVRPSHLGIADDPGE